MNRNSASFERQRPGWTPPSRMDQVDEEAPLAASKYQESNSDADEDMDKDPRERSIDAHVVRMRWWRAAFINCLFILAWYSFSTLISLYNKWMFSKEHLGFGYPLFVTTMHMLVQWTLAGLTLMAVSAFRSNKKPSGHDYLTKVAPCGMATGLDIGLSNMSLQTITLSFYTMCKSSSLAFVLLFAFLFRLEKPTLRLCGVIFIMTFGVVLMVSAETHFEMVGMVLVLTASALGGLRWSLTQMLLDKESMGMPNPIATIFYLAPVMGATLGIVSIAYEGWGNVFAQEQFFGDLWSTIWTIGIIIFPGCLAFLMNVAEFGLIQRTSVVTLSVAGIFKEVVVIFTSTVIFHDILTPINIVGLIITIIGIALYNYYKFTQFKAKEQTNLSRDHQLNMHHRVPSSIFDVSEQDINGARSRQNTIKSIEEEESVGLLRQSVDKGLGKDENVYVIDDEEEMTQRKPKLNEEVELIQLHDISPGEERR